MINVFISYAHPDLQFKNELERYLSPLKRSELILNWIDLDIRPGEEWTKTIKSKLKEADLIILLISADFLASGFLFNDEFTDFFLNDEKYVFPILVRYCLWEDVEILRKRQVFPLDHIPIESIINRDRAFIELSQTLEKWLYEINTYETKGEETIQSNFLGVDLNLEKKQLFVSHCHEDGDFAELIKLRLEKEGFDVWIDTDRLKIGQVWREEIDDAIRKSHAFIIIMTPDARNSEYVTYEWAFAWGAGIKIFPIQLKKTPFHPRLESLQYLDFSNRESRPWSKLVAGLK